MTPKPQRLAARAAHALAEHFSRSAGPRVPQLPDAEWERCQKLVRWIGLAQEHGWHHAAARLGQLLNRALEQLSRNLALQAYELVEHSVLPRKKPEIRELYAEIVCLFDEFPSVEWNPTSLVLSVETEPIELEDVPLGPFSIRLDCRALPASPEFEVVALDPNPASSNHDVTHPHVLGNDLCLGEGRAAIDQALSDLRLSDFFRIVQQILRTYNSDSAYVSLAAWSGCNCDGCGDTVHPEDLCVCELCDAELCEGCSTGCEACGRSTCRECLDSCSTCDDLVCRHCREGCSDCGKTCCSSCLEGGICHACREARTENESESQESPPELAAAAVQPDGLGQADVSEGLR
jgi:hypothetical protein